MDVSTVALIGVGAYIVHRIIMGLTMKHKVKQSYEREVIDVLNNPNNKVKGRFE